MAIITSCPCPPPRNGHGCACNDHYYISDPNNDIQSITFGSNHSRILNVLEGERVHQAAVIKADLNTGEFPVNEYISFYADLNVSGNPIMVNFYARLMPDGSTIITGPNL